MEVTVERDPAIDPQVKAFIFSLVSALGGSSGPDDGGYILGDDALAVLKDIKRWLRLYDDKTNRLDVARLLAEANLVKGDLLEILATWRDDAATGSFRSKIALICVDLLTQLTWPIEKDEKHTQMHHFVHLPYLERAHVSYKRAILHHERSKLLRTIVRVALPAMAQSKNERSPTDDNIIKVVLYFFRNMAMITQPEGQMLGEDEDDVSRSATIDAFYSQDIFSLLLTVSSSMLEEFPTHDVEVLDVLFHLLKGVDVERLFLDKEELVSRDTQELLDLVSKEKSMLASYARHGPSRHNRFGTMLWIKRDGERYSTVFGQGALNNEQLSMAEMDKTKKWKKPRYTNRNVPTGEHEEFDTAVHLTASARRHLRSFVEQFLDSSFNPLFASIRKSIEREVERVLESNTRQYLYLIAWFLRAERARRKKQNLDMASKQQSAEAEAESFGLVASVLNQETFVLLNRNMQNALDRKEWKDLNAGMKCFSQILLTVQEMSESPLDEDQEIAENILSRIFYEQTTHDRIVAILRSYKDQGFGYLDACTELSHVFLRLLERYSKQNVDLQVRSIRRARKKKTKEQRTEAENALGERELEAEDLAEAQRTTSERKFDFSRFAAKFVNQASVDTYFAFLRHYTDLSVEQLKRAHRFFYRTAFKMDLSIFLFRLDVVMLLNKMVKGPEGLPTDNPTFKEWEELTRQVFRRLIKKLEERPALAVELLFSKIKDTMFYLQYGYDKKTPKKIYRPPAELEVKPGMTKEQEIGVVVSTLINQSKSDLLSWLKSVLNNAAAERKAWSDEQLSRLAEATAASEETTILQSVEGDEQEVGQQSLENLDTSQTKPPIIRVETKSNEEKTAMQKDKHVRLLMKVLGFDRIQSEQEQEDVEVENATWVIPGGLQAEVLRSYLEQIRKFEFEPPVYDEGKTAEDFIRRQTSSTSREANNNANVSDSEGASGSELERELFAPGGPTVRQTSNPPEPKKRKRLRNGHAPDEFIEEGVLEERREARRKVEAEKLRKIKSTLYVHESDDESDNERDREFFAREEDRRKNVGRRVVEAMLEDREGERTRDGQQTQKSRGKKRKSGALSDDGDVGGKDSGASDSEASATSSPARDEETKRRPKRHERNLPKTGLGISLGDEPAGTGSQPYPKHTSESPRATPDQEHSAPILGSSSDSEADTDAETPPTSQRSSDHAQAPILDEPKLVTIREDTDMTEDAERMGSVSADEDSDKENAVMRAPLKRRNVRAGFVVDSDSDE